MGLDRCFLEPDGCSPRSCVGAIASEKPRRRDCAHFEIFPVSNCSFRLEWCRKKPRRPFCDQKYRRVDGKQETRLFCSRHGAVSPRRLAASARARHLTRTGPRPVHSRPRYRPISAAREARGCVADLCESRARGCSIVRPSAAAGACGSRSAYRVRPVCGCLARAIRVFRPSTRCATPAGPATCAYSAFCMRVGCGFIVPVRMLRGI